MFDSTGILLEIYHKTLITPDAHRFLSGKLAPFCYIIGVITGKTGGVTVYSKEYEEARKDFINCLVFGVICLGVPFYFAYTEWWPIMKREKEKALAQK